MSMTEERRENIWALAFESAEKAGANGEVPVGAVLVSVTGEIVSSAANETIARNDPTAHAEMLVLREGARKLGNQRLDSCDLYVTLEPCAMCAAALSFARLRRLYYAASDVKGGAVENGVRFFNSTTCHHRPEIYGGFYEDRASGLLKGFFARRR
jgi:tRNA(adenine34) deaminase